MVKGKGKEYMLAKTKREEKTGHHRMDGSTSGVEAKDENLGLRGRICFSNFLLL